MCSGFIGTTQRGRDLKHMFLCVEEEEVKEAG